MYTWDVIDVLREQATTGGVTTTSLFVHGRASDQPLLRETGGISHYYHLDGSSSVVAETTAAGAIERTYEYDAWGQPPPSSADSGFRYASRDWDPETRLYYVRARYYDPSLGRFISEDPQGMTDGPNVYAYVGGNPVGRIDPSGTTWQDWNNCKRNFATCAVTGLCYVEAEGLERRLTGGNSDNDPNNAVKHCFWSCCIARVRGFKEAKLAVDAHESDDRNSTDPARACSSEMDRWNNRMGASMGANLEPMSWETGTATCEQKCKEGGGLRCSPRNAPASNCSNSGF
jgi:RHS repeat-associated protein